MELLRPGASSPDREPILSGHKGETDEDAVGVDANDEGMPRLMDLQETRRRETSDGSPDEIAAVTRDLTCPVAAW